ncbi:MAG: 23S rRNA (guanosine(2251)-2'-O)-methyltransferase RlmB [Gammaproteobacteria bacterium]|nr:23S rRNA (guanosine(2251)-2'-O)-methyltransferase RlmB [Gammaproteobacteria bacterium]
MAKKRVEHGVAPRGENSEAASFIYGMHAVTALLERPQRIITLYVDHKRLDQRLRTLLQQAAAQGVRCENVAAEWLTQQVGEVSHQGVVALTQPQPMHGEAFLDDLLTSATTPLLLLVLDGVQDPHNLGACLRSADAAGVAAVVIPKDRACGLNATVRKVASGAAESVPLVQVTNVARTLQMLKDANFWLLGTALDEQRRSLYDLSTTEVNGALALVMGAEERGLRRLTKEHCDALVAIPMHGMVESLNVSVATAVTLFELVRRRQMRENSAD